MSRHSQRGQHVSLGTCPVCGNPMSTAMDTCWRAVEGTPKRVHRACVPAPPVEEEQETFEHEDDTLREHRERYGLD